LYVYLQMVQWHKWLLCFEQNLVIY